MDDETLIEPKIYARKPEAVEDDSLLPSLATPYAAVGRFSNKAVPRLVVVFGKEGFRPGGVAYVAFQYVHLGVGEFGFTADGQMFRFLVSDLESKRLTVHGRDLLRTFDGISLHRVPWIRQIDRDFRSLDGSTDGKPVITRITVEEWRQPAWQPDGDGQ